MNILLVGDLGSNKDGFYHAGDEAMFYAAYRWYRHNKPAWDISIITRYKFRDNLELKEYEAPFWPTKKISSKIYFFKFTAKLIFWKLFKINLMSSGQKEFINFLDEQDRIHFTGGGNITSISTYRYYFYFFIIVAGKVLGKRVALTSQTIGPFFGMDRLFIPFILNLPERIFIREPIDKSNPLKKFGVFAPNVAEMFDAAYTLEASTSLKLPDKHKGTYRIGLSVHRWKEYSEPLKTCVIGLMHALSKEYKIEIVLIPHILTRTGRHSDNAYMSEVLSCVDDISVRCFSYNDLMNSSEDPSTTIKYLTSQIDVLITSRYHGIVFALSENVPCIPFAMDDYYNQKNIGALKLIYDNNYQNYLVDLNKNDSPDKVIAKTLHLIKRLDEEKRLLIKKNAYKNKKSEFISSKVYFNS